MRFSKTFLVLILFFAFSSVIKAKIIHVPGDSATIQGGIDGALSGDTVLVAPGKYYPTETLWLKDSVRVQGAGIDLSVIEASDILWDVIWGAWGAELEGFTIIGTDSTYGIFTYGDSMVISKNKITHFESAIDVGTNAVITENIIVHNRYWGIFCGDYYDNDLGPLISRNLIVGCGYDGITSVSSNIVALNNTIDNNGWGIWVQQSTDDTTAVTVTIKNNIITNNDWYGVYLDNGDPYGVETSRITINYNDVWNNNWDNYSSNWLPNSTDISEDPLFVLPLSPNLRLAHLSQTEITQKTKRKNEFNSYYTSLAKREKTELKTPILPSLTSPVLDTVYDYNLQGNSPCIDKGDPNSPLDPDSTISDMGAFYYHYLRGDANGNYTLSLADIVYLINYLFKFGPAPEPIQSGDANCDGKVSLGDIVYLINYLFKFGPEPCS